MAFGSAIPDKVNSFGVANTPVARITLAHPRFSAFSSCNFESCNWQNALFSNSNLSCNSNQKWNKQFNCSSYLGQGNPTSFFTLNRNRRSTASGPGISLVEMHKADFRETHHKQTQLGWETLTNWSVWLNYDSWPPTFFKRPPCLAHSNGHFAPHLGIFGDRHFHSNRLHEIQAGVRDFHQRFHTPLILIAFNHPTTGAILWSPTKINQLLSFCCLVGAVHVEIALFFSSPTLLPSKTIRSA